ncbi:MAG: rhodanese-like domain-containing protein [Actinomycetia bacterium]|nr:rhodanese-like domain-containing protein [Actinomycetes bacterium]
MITNIDRSELLSLIDDGALVLDVLPQEEYESGHIPGAVNLPLRSLDTHAVASMAKGKPVVVY